MYVYKITNLINHKIYIGVTNNYKKRWANHGQISDNCVIARAIRKYKKENFKFEILFSNLSIEEADEKEKQLIKEFNCLVPNGYNVAKGGHYNQGVQKFGESNSNACLTNEEAQYIKDHRDQPLYVLYEKFCDKISYDAFKKVYHDKTYLNIKTNTPIYPYNLEFSNQFTSNNKLDYGDVVYLREEYQKGRYWRDVFQEYKELFKDEWAFWNIYYGNRYKLVMPEVFTEELRKIHSSFNSKAGENNGRAKLNKEDVLIIRQLHKDGVSNSEIYKKYPQVSSTSIRNIINNKTWTNI